MRCGGGLGATWGWVPGLVSVGWDLEERDVDEDRTVRDAALRGDRRAREMRGLLLGLVVLGAAGLMVELVTLEHTASTSQWLPIAALVAAVGTSLALLVRPARRTVRAQQGAMLVLLGLGVVGLVLHFKGNVAFELEIEPDTRGLVLMLRALYGATPALAPGALVELSLVGLVQTWGHPALAREKRASTRAG